MTPNVEFKTVTEFRKIATKIVKEIEKTGKQVVITKNGKPVAFLQRVTGKERGQEETVSNLKLNALVVIAEIEMTGKPLVITRDGKPVVTLKKAVEKAFSIED